MLSAVLFIAGAIALLAGVAYFIFTYGNFLIGFINSFFESDKSTCPIISGSSS